MSKDKVTKILFFQGDSVIRYFEITPEPPFVHYINTFQTPGEIEKNDSLFLQLYSTSKIKFYNWAKKYVPIFFSWVSIR